MRGNESHAATFSPYSLTIACVVGLATCTKFDPNWTPVVDVANDPHADRLKYDTDQRRRLALKAGKEDVPLRSRSTFMDDDGDLISKPIYERSFSTRLKLRKHLLLN